MNKAAPIEMHPFQYFHNLEESLLYDKFRYGDYREMKQLTDEIWSGMAFRKNRSGKWLTLFNILCNLKYALEQLKVVAVSRNKEYYRLNERSLELRFNYYDTIPIIDALEAKGLIHTCRGFLDRETGKGRSSRIWASRELAGKLLKIEEVCLKDSDGEEELIVLKGRKHELTYPDTEFILGLKARLQAYNKFMKRVKVEYTNIPYTDVFLKLVKSIQPKLPKELRCNDAVITDYKALSEYVLFHKQVFSLMPEWEEEVETANPEEMTGRNTKTEENIIQEICQLYKNDAIMYVYPQLLSRIEKKTKISSRLKAVFNRKSFFRGGRLYSGANGWQSLNGQQRATITLDGEQTVELDFSALHINMLYAQEGSQCDFDPYDVVCEDKSMRPALKLLLLVAINAESDDQTLNVLSRKTDEILERVRLGDFKTADLDFYKAIKGQPVDWSYWLDKFKTIHYRIAKHFCDDSGIKLMNRDSKIILNAVNYCVQNRIPCLPVHDSVIVAEQRKDEIEAVMRDAYRKEMGFDCKIK